MTKDQALAAAGVLVMALLGWGGNTLIVLGNKVSTLEATQIQLVKQIDRTLDALTQ